MLVAAFPFAAAEPLTPPPKVNARMTTMMTVSKQIIAGFRSGNESGVGA